MTEAESAYPKLVNRAPRPKYDAIQILITAHASDAAV
jgi:hypothetical protein